MGFEQVYEYEDGKRDWGSFGLPREGRLAEQRSGGDAARRDVPTCLLTDDLTEVRRRVRSSEWNTCIVVNEHSVVLGRLGREVIASDEEQSVEEQSVEEAMTEGPSTVRPSIGLDALVRRIREKNLTSWLVTTPDGRLVGLVLLAEAEELLQVSGKERDRRLP
jgi:Mg/Co/Ni transporter MgtE